MALVGQDEGDEATTGGESVGGPSPAPPMTPPPPATPRSVFTCCVGKTLSQAEFQLHSAHETAGIARSVGARVARPPHARRPRRRPPRRSCRHELERPQLAKRLVGRQLLFVLDYDGCDDEGSSTNLARFLSVYPVARVLREADEGGDDDDGADGAAAGAAGYSRALRARAASGSSARRSRCGRRTSCRTARRSRGSGRRARASRGSWRSRSRRCTGRRSRRAWRSCARDWAGSTAWRSRTMRSPCRWGTAARRRRSLCGTRGWSTRRCASCRCCGASTAATRTRSVPTRSGTSRRSSSTWWAPSSSRSGVKVVAGRLRGRRRRLLPTRGGRRRGRRRDFGALWPPRASTASSFAAPAGRPAAAVAWNRGGGRLSPSAAAKLGARLLAREEGDGDLAHVKQRIHRHLSGGVFADLKRILAKELPVPADGYRSAVSVCSRIVAQRPRAPRGGHTRRRRRGKVDLGDAPPLAPRRPRGRCSRWSTARMQPRR